MSSCNHKNCGTYEQPVYKGDGKGGWITVYLVKCSCCDTTIDSHE